MTHARPPYPSPPNRPPWYPGANGGVSVGTTPPENPIRGHMWWDGVVLWVWDGVEWVAPAMGSYPGVTDGSKAKPGYPGEIWTATSSGSWTGGGTSSTPPSPNFVIPSVVLPAGDWDFSWQALVPDQISMAMMRLAPPPTGATNSGAACAVTIPTNVSPDGGTQALILNGPTTSFSIASSMSMICNLFVWPSGIVTDGTYTAGFWARRMR